MYNTTVLHAGLEVKHGLHLSFGNLTKSAAMLIANGEYSRTLQQRNSHQAIGITPRSGVPPPAYSDPKQTGCSVEMFTLPYPNLGDEGQNKTLQS
jgi:hypothetical protein